MAKFLFLHLLRVEDGFAVYIPHTRLSHWGYIWMARLAVAHARPSAEGCIRASLLCIHWLCCCCGHLYMCLGTFGMHSQFQTFRSAFQLLCSLARMWCGATLLCSTEQVLVLIGFDLGLLGTVLLPAFPPLLSPPRCVRVLMQPAMSNIWPCLCPIGAVTSTC